MKHLVSLAFAFCLAVLALALVFPVQASATAIPSLYEEPREVALHIEDDYAVGPPAETAPTSEIPPVEEISEAPVKERGLKRFLQVVSDFVNPLLDRIERTNDEVVIGPLYTIIGIIITGCIILGVAAISVFGLVANTLIAEVFAFLTARFTGEPNNGIDDINKTYDSVNPTKSNQAQ